MHVGEWYPGQVIDEDVTPLNANYNDSTTMDEDVIVPYPTADNEINIIQGLDYDY